MSVYMVTANYNFSSVKGMVANPHNREEAIKGLLDKLGVELKSLYVTHGGKIYMVCSGTADAMGTMGMVVMATGSIENPSIEEVVSGENQMVRMEAAQQFSTAYKPANA